MNNYRINILSIGIQMMGPSKLSRVVNGVNGGWLGLPVGHLGYVTWRWQGANHVTAGIAAGQIGLLLLTLPSSAKNRITITKSSINQNSNRIVYLTRVD